ncbi:MAG TPA: rhomboid family intramembrane serine protease [Planctomycetota bacterium]|nr:rhomboid family intramembrane serine protease [Planctomycetota bacterium]
MEYEQRFHWPALTPAVRWLLLANTAVFLLNAVLVGATGDPDRLAQWLGVSGTKLLEGWGLGVVRLVTYQFVHAFLPPFHFLFNMLVLYFFGTWVERGIGRRRFFALYLTGGVVGALVEIGVWLLLEGRAGMTVVGASGACYCVTIYAACMDPRAIVYLIVFPVQMRVLAWILVGLGAYELYASIVLGVTGGVAHGCHLGGAFWGYLAYRQRIEPVRLLDRLSEWRERRKIARRAEDQATLDQLLEKVHRQGLSSLTPAERRFLDRRSRDLRGR